MIVNEKWNLLVEEFNAHKSAKEDAIQRLWESIFAEIFGYSRLNGEIESHRKMRIGAIERVVPDIIIKEKLSKRDLFIVELKQHLFSFEPKYKEQLFSYMKLFRINVGILICNEIWLFMFDENNTELSMNIPFLPNCENGYKFVDAFSKGVFDEQLVKQFIKNDIAKKMQMENIANRINEIRADIQKRSLAEIVKSYYSSNYTNNEIEQALNGLKFNVQLDKNDNHSFTWQQTDSNLNNFRCFLVQRGYSDNTISSYLSALKSICGIESITFDTLFNDIDKYAHMYDREGSKNYLGQRGHGTWRNALNRLFDYYYSVEI